MVGFLFLLYVGKILALQGLGFLMRRILCLYLCYILQHRLKSSQRDKVRQFITFTETNEKTAINCLSQHDWRLDVASDSYFQNPERYYIDTKPLIDKKRLSHLFDRYKGRHEPDLVYTIQVP